MSNDYPFSYLTAYQIMRLICEIERLNYDGKSLHTSLQVEGLRRANDVSQSRESVTDGEETK